MKYFGAPGLAPIYRDTEQALTPEGAPCGDCGELISAGDRGWLIPSLDAELTAFHRECQLRALVGSVQHQLNTFRGAPCPRTCRDDPAVTRRVAARAACDLFECGCGGAVGVRHGIENNRRQ